MWYCFICFTRRFNLLRPWMKFLTVLIQLTNSEQEISQCGVHYTVCYTLQGGSTFWVCGWNQKLYSFKCSLWSSPVNSALTLLCTQDGSHFQLSTEMKVHHTNINLNFFLFRDVRKSHGTTPPPGTLSPWPLLVSPATRSSASSDPRKRPASCL